MIFHEIVSTLWGTIINAGAIVIGGTIGIILTTGIPKGMKDTVMNGIGLAIMYIGIQMAFESTSILILIFSLIIGAIIGESFNIEQNLTRAGDYIKAKVGSQGNFTEGLVFATIVYCVGALAVMGPLESGLSGEHDILYAKSIIDGTTAIAFSASLGMGVLFSAIPVLLYQGIIAVFSQGLGDVLGDEVIQEMSAAGGLMILAIGLNILGLTQIKVSNLLPGLVVAVLLANLTLYLGL